ncbi:hypothetical protein SMIR_19330 [Streptomyces mirabilis]|nr:MULTISPECIES: hypothetical protein [Streptomyces]QIY72006.1 hypothetical protein HEP84_25525 [Streptomyces sp. RLB1-33]QUW81013.1 hypothetical protein SMIR_19330 [Streptomyces mirabilis]
MRRATWLRGRRGALVGASTAVVCLGAVLAACGDGGSGGGYVAVGAPADSGPVVAPTGNVSLTPLPGSTPPTPPTKGAPQQGSSPPQPPLSASPGAATNRGDDNSSRTSAGSGTASAPPTRPTPGSTASTSPPGTPSPPGPVGPAVLDVGEPTREATDRRWCEKVTVSFRNTGGTAVRSGTVTLGTHIIGALGIDWATIDSTRDLPAPIAAGAGSTKTWTVCVDDWRVPLGMHIETRDVSVQWK